MALTILDEGIIWKNPHPSAYARIAISGHSVQTRQGDILHAMQVGQARMSPDSRCLLTRSGDLGKSWSIPEPLNTNNLATEWAATRVVMSNANDGALLASAVRSTLILPGTPGWLPVNGGWTGSEARLFRSNDSGRTWSCVAPIEVPSHEGGFFVVSTPPLDMGHERLGVVIEPMFTGPMKSEIHQDEMIFSSDGGRTWGDRTLMAKDPTGNIIYFDPRPSRLSSGRWCCLLWTHDARTDQSLEASIIYSSDDGRSWSAPRRLPFWGFLSVPLCLSDGRLLVVYNHRRHPQGVRCIISDDEGQTWRSDEEIVLWDQSARKATGARCVESSARQWTGTALTEMFSIFDYGIPHPIELSDGSVFISFYATALDHVMHQRFVRLNVRTS